MERIKLRNHVKKIILVFFLFIISACQVKTPKTTQDLTISLTYIPNIQFAPFYVALEKGYFESNGLKVSLNYGNEADLVALVGSGNQKFMIASGEQILLSRAQGLPVVYVAAWYEDYPVGVVSLKSKGIVTPQDLKGKSIGIPGLYGASYIGFKALQEAAGLADTEISLESIGFTQVEAIMGEQTDAAVIYVANEPVQLRSLGYDVNLLRVSDYLDLVGNGLVTNEETIKNEPELVSKVTQAVLKGIDYTAKHPDEAYDISTRYVENLAQADKTIQMQVLSESIQLWQTQQLGYSDMNGWENMQQLLINIGLMQNPVDLSLAFTNDFID